MIRLLLALCSLAAATAAPLQPDPLQGAKRIVFLGDSITNDGHYIVLLEGALRETHPDAVFINLGLPSEGCTGLSEPAHPFPRPNVHERLDRALAKTNPDVVFACYGMNDGIYYPFSEERFQQYQTGINTLIDKVTAHGAKLILMTPPPFDPLPMQKKGKLLMAETIYEALYGKLLPEIPADTLALVSKQHALLHPAWISEVGHRRPGVQPGLPLKEAQTTATALSGK